MDVFGTASIVEIGMRLSIDLNASRAVIARRQQLIRRRRFAEHGFRQFDGEEPLADAARPREEIGVGQSAAAHGAAEFLNVNVMSLDALPGHRSLPSPTAPPRPDE